jgi:two-component system NtrC family response regulator
MDDMPLLVEYFINKFSNQLNKPDLAMSAEALRLLMKLPWEGNIRELENTIERAAILCNNSVIEADDVQPDSLQPLEESAWSQGIDLRQLVPDSVSLNDVLYAIEEKMLIQALEETNHVQARAADRLGITKSLLQYKMKKYRIKKRK